MLVFLIGYMGSGKSSIGRRLAAHTGFEFLDTDREIEKEYGGSVNEIFETEGETYFRRMERRLLENLDNSSMDVIIATGGGMPCAGDNMEIMNRLGMTAYLKFSPEKLMPRLAGGRNKRPIIRGMDDSQLLEFIKASLATREPYYEQASVIVEGDGAGDDYLCRHIAECIAWVSKQTGGKNV